MTTIPAEPRNEAVAKHFPSAQLSRPVNHLGFTRGSIHPGPAAECVAAFCRMSAPNVPGSAS